MQEMTQDMETTTIISLVAAIVCAIAAVVSACVAVYSARQSKTSSKTAERSAVASEHSAESAKQTAESISRMLTLAKIKMEQEHAGSNFSARNAEIMQKVGDKSADSSPCSIS